MEGALTLWHATFERPESPSTQRVEAPLPCNQTPSPSMAIAPVAGPEEKSVAVAKKADGP